jgi:hypothetical protein
MAGITITTGHEAQAVGMGLEKEREIIATKNIRRPEAMGQEVAESLAGQGMVRTIAIAAVGAVDDQDAKALSVPHLLKELPAVAAGSRGNGQNPNLRLAMLHRVEKQELLGVDGVVEGQAGELEVHATEHTAAAA